MKNTGKKCIAALLLLVTISVAGCYKGTEPEYMNGRFVIQDIHDGYNIWVQSGDIGVICYSQSNDEWVRNDETERPDYIVSKYDD